MIKDPELIKQITIKDFDYFTDHRTIIPENVEPIWGKNLLSLKGKRWKDMRAIVSPSFTSSKMKMMFKLINDCAENMTKYYLENPQDGKSVEMKDILSRFTNDVIASTAFGVTCNSFAERKNEFYVMGKEATDLTSFKTGMKLLTCLFAPNLIPVKRFSEISSFITNDSF